MKKEKDHIIYTAEDIKRYITGTMPPEEMHAIEMAALDDPLLAEAMEGYELMEQKDWSKELAALKQNFTEKNEQTPVIPIAKNTPFKWWKAAAAILVLGTAATTAYLFTAKNNSTASETVATNEVLNTLTDSAGTISLKADSAGTVASVTAADSSKQLLAQTTTGPEGNSSPGAFTFTTPDYVATAGNDDVKMASDSNFIYRPAPAGRELLAMKDDRTSTAPGAESVAEKEYKAESNYNFTTQNGATNNAVAYNNNRNNNYYDEKAFTISEQPDVVALDKKARQDNNQNNFSGLVLSPDNKPISYASVKIAQFKKPVYTDANGTFHITVPDTSVNVLVTSAGYNAQKFTLQNSGLPNKIVLEPQLVATESLGKAKKETSRRKQQVFADSTLLEDEDAEPAGGWIEYNNYLSSNLRFPEDARQKNIHGEVEISVKLNNKGDVSQIKVDKPLCPDCDAEAIRLVKEGPKFDVKNTKKKKIKIKIKF